MPSGFNRHPPGRASFYLGHGLFCRPLCVFRQPHNTRHPVSVRGGHRIFGRRTGATVLTFFVAINTPRTLLVYALILHSTF